MPINSIEPQNVNNNKSSIGRRVVGSVIGSAVTTSLIGAVDLVGSAYSSPRIEKETFFQHILRDLGNDVKKRYTKVFSSINLSKLSQKVSNAKPSTLAKIWLGMIFGLLFAGMFILSGKEKKSNN